MAAPLVELIDVCRHYKTGYVHAVEDVSLSVAAGEFLAIVGPSGSGKTTLLNLLGGLDRPTRGSVRFAGREPRDAPEWARIRAAHIGYVFQAFHLLPTLNALENVQIPMLGVERNASRREQRARALLAELGLTERAQHHPDELSGGEQQRVAIARSLANAPRLILADEPTGNLDSTSAAAVVAALVQLVRAHRVALVLVTHNRELTRAADRVLAFRDGRVVDPPPGKTA